MRILAKKKLPGFYDSKQPNIRTPDPEASVAELKMSPRYCDCRRGNGAELIAKETSAADWAHFQFRGHASGSGVLHIGPLTLVKSQSFFFAKIFHFKVRSVYLLILLLLPSCTPSKIDPSPSFYQVKNEVNQRTGQTIQWNCPHKNCSLVREFIEQTLAHQLTVNEVIQIALLNNKRLQGLYENLGIAQAEVVQASLFKNPIFDYQLRYDHGFGSNKMIESGIIQNFLDILLKPVKKRIACKKLEIIKNQVIGEVMEVITEAKIAFYTLQSIEKIHALRCQILETTDAVFDVATRLKNAGNIKHLEFTVKQLYYEQSKIDVSQIETEIFEAREKLNVLMGLWGLQVSWTITPELEELPQDIVPHENIENDVVINSLDLEVARKQICSTAAKIGVDTAEIIFPALGIGANSERESNGTWFIGPQFVTAIPLFDFGQARLAAGRAELNQLCQNYYALAVHLRSCARLSSFKLWNSYQQNRYFEKVLIPLAEEVTMETSHQLNAMQISVFDALLAKQREFETKEKAIHTYKDYWIAYAELELLKNGRMKHKREMN